MKLARNLPLIVNFYKTQNSYYDTLKRHYPGLKAAAENNEEDAKTWVSEFEELGPMLSVKVK